MSRQKQNGHSEIRSLKDLTRKDKEIIKNSIKYNNDDPQRRFDILWFLVQHHPDLASKMLGRKLDF